jgi:lipopolysaccharide export system protein LptC
MRATSAALLPLALLTLLAGATFWLERATKVDDGSMSGKSRHDPDFIIDKFTTRRFNLDGGLQHSLTAQKMTHYADDDTTEVALPALTYFAHQPPTQLNARQAWISTDGKEVRLTNEVRMVRPASRDQAELVVTSSELSIFPDDEKALTDKPVTIASGRSLLNGKGLEADNRTHIFTLLGRAQGTIYKTTRQTP